MDRSQTRHQPSSQVGRAAAPEELAELEVALVSGPVQAVDLVQEPDPGPEPARVLDPGEEAEAAEDSGTVVVPAPGSPVGESAVEVAAGGDRAAESEYSGSSGGPGISTSRASANQTLPPAVPRLDP